LVFSGYPHTSKIAHHGFESRLAHPFFVLPSFLPSFTLPSKMWSCCVLAQFGGGQESRLSRRLHEGADATDDDDIMTSKKNPS